MMNSPTFMAKHINSNPADKTGTGTAVDSIDPEEQEELLGDLQEGIQADDSAVHFITFVEAVVGAVTPLSH